MARQLLGAVILGNGVSGRIAETEAYHQSEPACHGHRGVTPRCRNLFGPPGTLYVYRSYGIHLMLNLVCEGDGVGSAVLIRSLEPLSGLDLMRSRRGVIDPKLLCAGPGRLAQALAVEPSLDGLAIPNSPFALLKAVDEPSAGLIRSGPRIGISVGEELDFRFALAGEEWLSQPFPAKPGD